MNREFNKFKLGELTTIIAGGDKPFIFSENKTNSNKIPVFANAEGNNGLQGYTNTPRIIEPAVTISARGSKVGFAAIRKQPFFPIVRLLTLIPVKDKLSVDYLFYNLKLNRQNGTGSGQPQITIPEISEKIISVPALSTQQKIAKVLSDLDAKIELNNKINAELEAMAKTLYDYWFVQFDFPDDNGKPYKSSGGKMVWNAELKREIPDGWEVKELIDIESNIITGKTPSTKDEENFGGDIPFVTIDDIRQQLFVFNAERTLTKKGGDSQINKYLQPGDICVSCIGTIGVIGIIGKICQTNQQINSISNISDCNRYFLLNALKDYFHFNLAAKKGAVLDNMNKGDFSIIPILDATTDLKIRYNKTVKSFYSKIEINLKENQELASLRDWLLPMLMNGQVSVASTSSTTKDGYEVEESELGLVAEEI